LKLFILLSNLNSIKMKKEDEKKYLWWILLFIIAALSLLMKLFPTD
jgi:hypothetical protein